MAIINEHGLFQGKRLRRCSTRARLLWPYLYVASNGFARSELDYDFIADQFASFRADAPTSEELAQYFSEFQANHLIFTYQHNGQSWGQWDTPRSHTKEYKTANDKASPAPPEAPYVAWLKEQHGADWAQFHWNKDTFADPRETFAQNSAEILTNVDRNFGLGVGVGVGGGLGNGEVKVKSDSSSRDARTDSLMCLTLKDGSCYRVPPERIAELSNSYPRLDVTSELHHMAEWLTANPKRRKTAAGIGRFIVAWLNRAGGGTKKPRARDLGAMDYSSLERASGGVQ